ncbi:hypothetical protein N7494_005377 [Penicillium frequentans]|uniref:BTB domain-containing protein n=1 Tax=Penicillium frequentans TaxID=3151616 RepID=A0AAD6GFD1_9EURO|nr:hypothetical protein N7494_005377 [Penicillium glabrum]
MTETTDSVHLPVVNIAETGDIILVVGPEQLKLRVESLILKAASKSLCTMFRLNWQEDRESLVLGPPVDILLPEENPTALTCICAILHYRIEMVPQIMSPYDVLKVAITADKYGLVGALTFANQSWLSPLNKAASDLIVLAAAASLFQNTQAFKEITKALVLSHRGSYLTLWSEDAISVLGERIYCLLEEQRGFARLKLEEILLGGTKASSCVHRCGWTSKYAYAYIQLLETQSLWPMDIQSVAESIERANRMPDPIPEERSTECKFGYKHFVPDYRSSYRYKLDNLDSCIGICLNCFLSKQPSAVSCQMTHEH